MSGPLVSILIKNFNYEPYLATAIRSAIDQTYPHVQVVVADDGSTDGSRAIIESFGTRIDSVLLPENRGILAVVNAGYAAVRGAIVMTLDSDDALRPEAAAEIAARWRPELAKVQFCLATIDRDGKFRGSIFPTFPSGLTPERVRREALRTGVYLSVPTSGNAYARTFLDQVMPLPAVAGASADGLLNTVAPLYGEVETLDKVLGFYRVHGGNIWAQQGLDPAKFGFYVKRDLTRVGFLRERAAAFGITVPADALDHAVEHMQYRLASRKLAPDSHPLPGESLGQAAWRTARAVARSRRSLASKLCLSAWIAGVVLAPRRQAERLVALRFIPGQRPALFSAALRRFNVLRRSEDGTSFDLPGA